jgi:hypothetical protein
VTRGDLGVTHHVIECEGNHRSVPADLVSLSGQRISGLASGRQGKLRTVQNLRVAGASVMPTIPPALINLTAS